MLKFAAKVLVMRFISKISFCLLLLASSCTPPSSIGGLDLEIWRGDRGACKGQRAALEENLVSVKPGLLGKSSNEIGRLFGAPDIQQLGKRNLKTYIYFLESGPHCTDKKLVSQSKKAVFRFNAVSLLTEINIQQAMPE